MPTALHHHHQCQDRLQFSHFLITLRRHLTEAVILDTCGSEQRAESPPVGGAERGAPVLTHGTRLSVQLVGGDAHVGRGRLRQGVAVVAEERQRRARVGRSQSHLTGLKQKKKTCERCVRVSSYWALPPRRCSYLHKARVATAAYAYTVSNFTLTEVKQ